jgi:hypothetical protein
VPDIFDEVEEELRADRARAMLQRYGGVMVGVAVAVVVAAGGWEAWRWHEAKRVASVAQTYLAGMQTADTQKGTGREAAVRNFATVAAEGSAGYRTLARLRAAGLKADAGDLAGASALWEAVAGDGSADPLLRDVARLQWALHNIDKGDPAAVQARLASLASPENPWHALAAEGQALLALRQGKTDAARETLKSLAHDVTTPPNVRRRAEGLLAQLGA